MAEVPGKRRSREVGDRARQLHSGRTASNDDKGQSPADRIRVRVALGPFERAEQAFPDRQRVSACLQNRSVRRPLILSKKL
jgi:hypothetical protein